MSGDGDTLRTYLQVTSHSFVYALIHMVCYVIVLLMYDTGFYSVSGGNGGRIHIEYGNRSFIKVIRFLSVEGRGRGVGRFTIVIWIYSHLWI